MVKRKGKPQGILVRNASTGLQDTKTKVAESSEAVQEETPQAEVPDALGDDVVPQTSSKKKKRKRGGIESKNVVEAAAEVREEPEKCKEVSQTGALPAQALGVAISALDGSHPPVLHSGNREEFLAWFLWPLTPATFFSEYWEKKPLHIKRNRPDLYRDVFSKAALDDHLQKDPGLAFGKYINLVRFDVETGKKIALSPERPPPGGPDPPRAEPKRVEAAWKSGASIQAMHPQQYHEPLWRLMAHLEGAFGSLFGANAYLTPAGDQGFAPHFDDVEVFMLQLEGEKHWRLHAPPAGEEYPLPREYSRDFTIEELGPQLLNCTVQPGDLLYLPRGTVHVGMATEAAGFSHHLSASTYQKTSWSDIMEKVLVSALGKAATESVDFRVGAPVNFLSFMGTWHENAGLSEGEVAEQRGAFKRRFKSLLKSLEEFADLDDVCDEMGVDFSAQRLPPPPVAASSSKATPSVSADTLVRWTEPSAIRLVLTSDPDTSEPTVALFHSCANEISLHMCRNTEVDEDVGCLRFEAATFLPALRALHAAGAGIIRCGDLPLADDDDKVMLCENLLEAGVLQLATGVADT